MRRIAVVAAISMALGAPARAQSGIQNGSMTINGVNRTYMVYLPSGLPANPPLVFSVHGMNQTNTWMRGASSWDKVADSAKIVVVYPQSDGARWDLAANGNDVKFFVALIDAPVIGSFVRRGVINIRYVGRRSGKTIQTPVGYQRSGDGIVINVMSPDNKTWWRNFLGDGGPITLVGLDGADREGHAVAHRGSGGGVAVEVQLAD